MLREGQHSTFPKIKFISNRRKLEAVISEGLKRYPSPGISAGVEQNVNGAERRLSLGSQRPWEELPRDEAVDLLMDNPEENQESVRGEFDKEEEPLRRRPSQLEELRRQSAVFFDDTDEGSHSEEDVRNYQTPRRVG
jgi:hypothetical protein